MEILEKMLIYFSRQILSLFVGRRDKFPSSIFAEIFRFRFLDILTLKVWSVYDNVMKIIAVKNVNPQVRHQRGLLGPFLK